MWTDLRTQCAIRKPKSSRTKSVKVVRSKWMKLEIFWSRGLAKPRWVMYHFLPLYFNYNLLHFGPKNGLVVDPLSWHRSMMATTLPIKNCFLKNINFCWNPPQNLRQEPLKNEIYASFADSPIIIELICALTGLFSDHYFKMVLPLPCLKLFLGVKKRSPPLLLIFSVANST